MTDARRIRARGTSIRVAVAALYVALAVCGIVRLTGESPHALEAAYTAQRALPAGHRLRPGDLEVNSALPAHTRALLAGLPKPEGRYLLEARKRAERVGVAQVSDTPRVQTSPGLFELPIPVASDLVSAGLVDVDSRVALCGTECGLQGLRVAAILCSAGAATCTAILDATEAQVRALAGHGASELHIVLQSDTTPSTPASQPSALGDAPPDPAPKGDP